MNMVSGILGKKLGMTQIFAADGAVVPVTVLQAGPCVVVQRKTATADGYDSAQLALVESRRMRNANKPTLGHFKNAGVAPARFMREVPVEEGAEPTKAGDSVNVSIFNPKEKVTVVATSKGRGFAGLIKRHHFGGGAATHGSMFHRAPGSIGASSFPSRVVKGMRAAGRMGGTRITTHNLKVLRVDAKKR